MHSLEDDGISSLDATGDDFSKLFPTSEFSLTLQAFFQDLV